MSYSESDAQKLANALSVINDLLPDSKDGLPDEVFYLVSRLTPLVNVDLLIVNEQNQKLLTWRNDQFYGPGWHIPGGIIRFKELAETRISKVAALELGVTVSCDKRPLLVREIMNPNREVRGHFISMVYKCKLSSPLRTENAAPSSGSISNDQWKWFSSMPPNMIKQHLQFEELINSIVY